MKKINPENNTLGQRLRRLRKNHGLSQLELASKIGYKAGAPIVKIEADRQSPTAFMLAKIANVLEIDLHWLITGKAAPDTATLANALRGPAEQYLSQLNQQIQEHVDSVVELDSARIFRGQDNQEKIDELQKEIDNLKAQYELIKDLFDQSLISKKGNKLLVRSKSRARFDI